MSAAAEVTSGQARSLCDIAARADVKTTRGKVVYVVRAALALLFASLAFYNTWVWYHEAAREFSNLTHDERADPADQRDKPGDTLSPAAFAAQLDQTRRHAFAFAGVACLSAVAACLAVVVGALATYRAVARSRSSPNPTDGTGPAGDAEGHEE